MADFIITHRFEAPELTAALNNLADAIRGGAVSAPSVQPVSTAPAQETPVQAVVEAPTATPPAAPVAAAPTAATPIPAPAEAPAPAPAQAPTKVYTFDDITAAGSQLLEQGRMPQLMELLKGYGVQAVTQLKPEQYADVAAGLRGLGAKI